MKSAAIRLDSFSPEMTGPGGRQGTSADLEHAFQSGYEKGLRDGRENSLDTLTQTITALLQKMSSTEEIVAASRRELAASLTPVLSAIVDLLGSQSSKDRLRKALSAELLQICETPSVQNLLIRCSPDMQADIETCLKTVGLENATIEPGHHDIPTAELIAGKASIHFDPTQVIAEMQAIIEDIMTED